VCDQSAKGSTETAHPLLIGDVASKSHSSSSLNMVMHSISMRPDNESLKHKFAVLKQHCEAIGRDYHEIHVPRFMRRPWLLQTRRLCSRLTKQHSDERTREMDLLAHCDHSISACRRSKKLSTGGYLFLRDAAHLDSSDALLKPGSGNSIPALFSPCSHL